jgi:hypothetical protein
MGVTGRGLPGNQGGAAISDSLQLLDRPIAGLATLVLTEDDHASGGYWYRANSTYPVYHRLHDLHHAEKLMGRIDDEEPWVTIVNGTPNGDSTYMQVLGTPDRLNVEGGIRINGLERSWRATARPQNDRPAYVGPAWYRRHCWESDVLTIHDASQLLAPALTATNDDFVGIPGLDAMWWD